jgi:hypothetical protein
MRIFSDPSMKTEQPPLAIAADNVIENCLGVKVGEVVTVLTDIADEERVQIVFRREKHSLLPWKARRRA